LARVKRQTVGRTAVLAFDAMGAKELQWRIGGTGQGAADQGRDLVMSFYMSLPDGELVKQHWWVEAKGRAGCVEAVDVKSSVVNVTGRTDIDVFVIATNAAFSPDATGR
jgi:hypothetical protein